MLRLTKKIGQGHEREVYRHPTNHALVVKVARPGCAYNRNDIEFAYKSRITEIDEGFIAHLYSVVETDRGQGVSSEYVCDLDGTPSPTLLDFVMMSEDHRAVIEPQVQEFFDWAGRHAICLYDVNPTNFLVQSRQDGSHRLVMIDGFGPRFMNLRWRLRMRSPALVRLRVMKSRRRMMLQWKHIRYAAA